MLLWHIGSDEFSGSELNSTSLTLLLELRVVRGVARNERYDGADVVLSNTN